MRGSMNIAATRRKVAKNMLLICGMSGCCIAVRLFTGKQFRMRG